MSHFAKVINGIVETVHVVDQDYIDSGKLGDPDNWIQTSYNTRGGVHHAPNSSEPDGGVALRKNYAGVGYTYDPDKDAFIPPKPFPSWVLNEDTCLWNPPTSYPDDGKEYIWDEDTTSWKEKE
mgnify:CR=1 FL=1